MRSLGLRRQSRRPGSRRKGGGFAAALLCLAMPLFAQQRIASDFEIAQMEQQLARSRDFITQLSGRLNLGDLRAARNERSLARTEYEKALDVATRERLDARRDSDMARYATATSYAALAEAKLGRDARAFELGEEAVRYTSDDAKTWNVYASAMTALARHRKAAAAARNAVAIAERANDALDLAVYRYALASALLELKEDTEAERLLIAITSELRSSKFDDLREQVARSESFEIYSTARGDAAAYLSLLNRAQLRLGALYERRGDRERARAVYARVLEARSDDANALAAMARLSGSREDRARNYAEAFDANPFSMALVREYRRYLETHAAGDIDDSTTGGQVRKALVAMHRGETRAARATLDALVAKFPANETLRALRRELDAPKIASLPSVSPTRDELRALIDRFDRLTPEERVQLDNATYASVVTFDASTHQAPQGQTIFESGTIDGVRFRFSEPVAFSGTFAAGAPLRLTYRILGVARGDALLVEPLGVQP